MMTMRNYTLLPSIQTGYELDDQFSVVVPIARTNLVTNPSFETNTTSWTAIGGSIARSTAQQYHGAYSLAITPTAATTDGARFDTVSLTAGVLYAYSAKVLGQAGRSYELAIETTAGVELTSTVFIASGRWQWVSGYYAENVTTTRRVTLRKNGGTDTGVFYLDGVQVEAIAVGETVSTFLDGDQVGFVPNQNPVAYYWNGTPHASTSARSGLTRAGGMVVKFKDFGFLLTAIIGLGLAAPMNAATEYARIDGGYDDYTRKPTRQFTLSGQFQAHLDYLQLRQYRGGLARLLDRDLVGQDQRLLLLREVIDPCGVPQSSVCRVIGKYQGGLSGNTDNQIAESTAITFTQYLPNVLSDGEAGTALDVQDSVTNANAIMQRSAAGVWSAMSTGMSVGGTVTTIVRGLNGIIYAGGDFTTAGASSADFIAQWDGSAWNVLGSATAINDIVWALAVGPDGALYVGGEFTNAGGVAAADGIAKWDGSAWTALGTGVNAGAIVYALTFGADGTLYAGGNFTSMGGVANTINIAKWNGSVWSAVGTGAAGGSVDVRALTAFGNTIYAGGDFNNMGGVAAADDIAKWDGSAWTALGTTGTNGSIEALAVGANGVLYIGGLFTTINGLSISYLAQWNGVAFTSVGALDSVVYDLVVDRFGVLHIGGQFTMINGVTYPDSFAKLSGMMLSPEDIDLPGLPIVFGLLALPDGTLYVGFNTNGAATTPGTTIVTNPGTAKAYPTIRIAGPSSGTARIWSMVNYTTSRAIYLNLTLSVGEVATLVFTPDNLSFTSNFQGNVASTILPGSNVADFFLQPGANSIAFFSASSTVTATLYFRPAFVSLDDVP